MEGGNFGTQMYDSVDPLSLAHTLPLALGRWIYKVATSDGGCHGPMKLGGG